MPIEFIYKEPGEKSPLEQLEESRRTCAAELEGARQQLAIELQAGPHLGTEELEQEIIPQLEAKLAALDHEISVMSGQRMPDSAEPGDQGQMIS